MRKIIAAVLAVMAMSAAAWSEEVRVIPYPESLDTKSEGASSVLGEVNHVPSPYYDADNDYFSMKSTKSRVILTHYPTYQQTRENTCGPVAGLTVLWWFGVKDYDEMRLADEMKTRPYPIGTNPKDMAAFFEGLDWKVESSLTHPKFEDYESFMKYVIDTLKSGTPIMVENVYWGGHWRVIIGYESMGTDTTMDDVLIMADSYDTCDHRQDGYTVENGELFYGMWFDHSMFPDDMKVQPFIVARPK